MNSEYHLKTDMPEAAGGRGVSPPPGVFGRANLGSCLSMGYMLRAAHQGIKIRSLEVEIQCDDDEGGLFGPDQQQGRVLRNSLRGTRGYRPGR